MLAPDPEVTKIKTAVKLMSMSIWNCKIMLSVLLFKDVSLLSKLQFSNSSKNILIRFHCSCNIFGHNGHLAGPESHQTICAHNDLSNYNSFTSLCTCLSRFSLHLQAYVYVSCQGHCMDSCHVLTAHIYATHPSLYSLSS